MPSALAPEPSGIPPGYAEVDPRTARRIPLWHQLRPDAPIFPGDPAFTAEVANSIADDGYLVERITSLGTHTGTHIGAPAHFIEGGSFVCELGERLALMPLAVIDVRSQVAGTGGDFTVGLAEMTAWEQRYGRFPDGGCVLLLTGFGRLFQSPDRAYFADAPGFTAQAVAWLMAQRGVYAIGSDTFGPDATTDRAYSASTAALARGGITVENVSAGLEEMRPHGDWIAINGGRPRFSGFQVGITGFTR